VRPSNCKTDGVHRAACVALALLIAPVLQGYSVLTHEAIIDSAWDANIKPLLLARYPGATPDDLRQAHAYAYGGCVIQDMGYYPFGSKFFSDLLHYVRSGDFVAHEIADAQNLNEYAFALGSLAHYAADSEGHRLAVNPSVGAEFPKLESKYGEDVTYADNPTAHLRVEFGFDVYQVARGNYASSAYRDFIGFQVSKELLDRAFQDTYGLQLKDLFVDSDLAFGTYRRAVGSVIPEMTRAAWSLEKKELAKSSPRADRSQFVFNLSRASYRKNWGRTYQQPGIGARLLAFLIRIVPKVGPFKAVAFKAPTPQTVHWFEASFDGALNEYRGLLAQVGSGHLQLANMNLDTGAPTQPANYTLADKAYAELVLKLAGRDGDANPKIRANILTYYRDLDLPFATKRDPKEWQKTVEAIDKLKGQTADALTELR
jgi:Zinc dependent phospholipase C